MATKETISEIWQAISILSDAQELIAIGVRHHRMDQPDTDRVTWVSAQDRINHAKRHLIVILDAARRDDESAFKEAIFTMPWTCSLEGHSD